jgi:hypothetical protein
VAETEVYPSVSCPATFTTTGTVGWLLLASPVLGGTGSFGLEASNFSLGPSSEALLVPDFEDLDDFVDLDDLDDFGVSVAAAGILGKSRRKRE